MRLLLHTCCGPCLLMPHDELKEGHDISVYYCNPNIDTKEEYEKRLAVVKDYVEANNIPFMAAEYDPNEYGEAVASDRSKPNRCVACYELRLKKAAHFAKGNGFDAFSTTLLISPYQHHYELSDVGENVSKTTGIDFLYWDFRPLYQESVRISGELGIYRQNYCGCYDSKMEREEKRAKKANLRKMIER